MLIYVKTKKFLLIFILLQEILLLTSLEDA